MASIGTNSPFVILMSVVFIISATTLSTAKVKDADIKHLCSKTRNPAECYKFLKSDPRTNNVDARGLLEVSVDLANNKAKNIHSELDSLVKSGRDTHMKNIYNLCSKNYKDAIHDMDTIKHKLGHGDHKNMVVQVKDAFEEVKSCEKVFNGATSDDAHLKKKNEEFKFLISIVKVVGDNFEKK